MTETNTPARRHDGWTPARQAEFIRTLAETGSVSAAVARVGMTSTSAYRLRLHPDAGDFRRAWAAALAQAWARVSESALDRALNGEVTVVEDGEGNRQTRHAPCPPALLLGLIDRLPRLAPPAPGADDLHAMLLAFPDRPGWTETQGDLASTAPALPPPLGTRGLAPDSARSVMRSRRPHVEAPDLAEARAMRAAETRERRKLHKLRGGQSYGQYPDKWI